MAEELRLKYVYVRDTEGAFAPATDPGSLTPSASGWFVTEYAYDVCGRRTASIVDPEGDDPLALETTYEYDRQDRIVKTTTPGGVWTKTERDGRGLEIAQEIGYGTETTPVLRTEYEYDANGNLTKVTEPSGRTTTYGYDPFDRRTMATVSGGSS